MQVAPHSQPPDFPPCCPCHAVRPCALPHAASPLAPLASACRADIRGRRWCLIEAKINEVCAEYYAATQDLEPHGALGLGLG